MLRDVTLFMLHCYLLYISFGSEKVHLKYHSRGGDRAHILASTLFIIFLQNIIKIDPWQVANSNSVS